ncbi:scabin-related ADP-ribosyltransferase [Nocardia cerradoensis]|uniref:scabin-related ADP-ribosyltransferase n=1 Tax=Nocardia cerradoensis TaxID=85688 RepID=UPI0002E05EC9|nr:hypothetical protein [Nocardia cerradoensis]
MGIEIPTELQWVAKYVVGAGDWPKGDETAMRRLADGWDQLADALTEIQADAGSVTTSALAAVDGKTHEAIKEFWDQVAGDKGLWPGLIEEVKGLSKDLDDTATDIEHTKYVIIATLVIFAIQMIQAIATACTGIGAPAAAAEEAAAQVAARLTIRQIIKWLIQKISTRALAKAAIIGVAQGAGVDAGASLLQMAQGKRGGFTGEEVKGLFAESVSGAVGGAVGAKLGSDGVAKGLVDKAGSTAGKFAARTAADAVGGAVGSVAGTAASVPFGGKFEIDPTTLATSSVAGAAQGAVGQVHEGRTAPASHESGTTDAGDTSAQPSPHTSEPAPAGTETGTTAHNTDSAPAPDRSAQPDHGNGPPHHTENTAPQHNTPTMDGSPAPHTAGTENGPSGHPAPVEHSVPEQSPRPGSSLNWDTDSPAPAGTTHPGASETSPSHDTPPGTPPAPDHAAPQHPDASSPPHDAPATTRPGTDQPGSPHSDPATPPSAAHPDSPAAAPDPPRHPDAGTPVGRHDSPSPQPDPAQPTATPHGSSVDPAAAPPSGGDRTPPPAEATPATTHAATADTPAATTPSAAPSMGSLGSLGPAGGEGTHRPNAPAHTPAHADTPHSDPRSAAPHIGPETASRPDNSRSPRDNARTDTPPASRTESPRPAPSAPRTTARPEPDRHTPGSTAADHAPARPRPESTPPARTPEPSRTRVPHDRNGHAQNGNTAEPAVERPSGAAAHGSDAQAPNGTRPPESADVPGRGSAHPGDAETPAHRTGEQHPSDDAIAAPHDRSDAEPPEPARTDTDRSAEAQPPTATPQPPPHRPGFDPAVHAYVARHNDGRMIHMDPFYSGRYNPHIDRYQPTPEEISAARAHPPGESPHDLEVRRWEEHRARTTEAPAAPELSPARARESATAHDSSPESATHPERTPTPSDRAGTPHERNTPPHDRTDAAHDRPANAPEHPARPAERPETPPLRREPEPATPPRWAHHDPNFLDNAMRPPEWMRRSATPSHGTHPAPHPEAPRPNGTHPHSTPRPEAHRPTGRPTSESPRPNHPHPETPRPNHPHPKSPRSNGPHPETSRPNHRPGESAPRPESGPRPRPEGTTPRPETPRPSHRPAEPSPARPDPAARTQPERAGRPHPDPSAGPGRRPVPGPDARNTPRPTSPATHPGAHGPAGDNHAVHPSPTHPASPRPHNGVPHEGGHPAAPPHHNPPPGSHPPSDEGSVGRDGVRRFGSDEAGQRYGDNRLAHVLDSLPPELQHAVRQYTVQSFPNGFLRSPNPLEAVGRHFDHLRAESHAAAALTHANRGEMPRTVADLDRMAMRRDLDPFQRQWVDFVRSQPDPVARLDALASNQGNWRFLHQYFDSPPTVEAFHRRIAETDAALNRPLPESVQVLRGLHDLSFMETEMGRQLGAGGDPRALIGTTQTERAYMSTSLGANLTQVDGRPFPFRIEMTVPAGSPGLWMGHDSAYPDQRELILQRHTRYRINDVVHTGWVQTESGMRPTFTVHAEVLPPEHMAAPAAEHERPSAPASRTASTASGPHRNEPSGPAPHEPARRPSDAQPAPSTRRSDSENSNPAHTPPRNDGNPGPTAHPAGVPARGETMRPSERPSPGAPAAAPNGRPPATPVTTANGPRPDHPAPNEERRPGPGSSAPREPGPAVHRPSEPTTTTTSVDRSSPPPHRSGPEPVAPTRTDGARPDVRRPEPTHPTPEPSSPNETRGNRDIPEPGRRDSAPAHTSPERGDAVAPHHRDAPDHAHGEPTPEQHRAIRDYTDPDGNHYTDLNNRLRNHTELDPAQEQLAQRISDGLSNLPAHTGTVWRGTSLSPEEIARYVPGETVTEAAFTSTSRDPRRTFVGNVEFVIHSSTGRDISAHSVRPGEREVLFDRNTTFEVRGVTHDPTAGLFGRSRIYLYETPSHVPRSEDAVEHHGPDDHAGPIDHEIGTGTDEVEHSVLHGTDRTAIGDDPQTHRVYDNLRNEGEHDVIVHGNRFGRPIPGHENEASPQHVAEAIRNNPNYQPGTPVRLISCHAGNDIGWAQQLADELGAPVRAPSDTVGVRQAPDSPAVVHDGGHWVTFHPGGIEPPPEPHHHVDVAESDGSAVTTEGRRDGWDVMASDENHLEAAVDPSVDISDMGVDPRWRTDNEPLYRSDNRPPAVIFDEGFSPRDPSFTDLSQYVEDDVPSAFVSTSTREDIGEEFGGRFTYELDAPGGIDVNETLGAHTMEYESEVAFPGGIRGEFIVGARSYSYSTGEYGDFIPNPNYVTRDDGDPGAGGRPSDSDESTGD